MRCPACGSPQRYKETAVIERRGFDIRNIDEPRQVPSRSGWDISFRLDADERTRCARPSLRAKLPTTIPEVHFASRWGRGGGGGETTSLYIRASTYVEDMRVGLRNVSLPRKTFNMLHSALGVYNTHVMLVGNILLFRQVPPETWLIIKENRNERKFTN